MSGPVDTPATPGGAVPEPPVAEVVDARVADVGGMQVRRSLPRARRRTVGAWCFVDHFGPLAVDADGGLDIGPHPHTGLSTVTYLLDGQVLQAADDRAAGARGLADAEQSFRAAQAERTDADQAFRTAVERESDAREHLAPAAGRGT